MGSVGVQQDLKTRIRTEYTLSLGQVVTPDAKDVHHLTNVLRLRVGDEVGLIDDQGHCFLGSLRGFEPCQIEVTDKALLADASATKHVETWVPLLKSKKTDTLVRQLTELGVSEIVVYLSERSVVRPNAAAISKLVSRYQRISAEATRQCGRTDEVTVTFSKELPDSQDGFFLWEEEGYGAEVLRDEELTTYRVLTGPEGGLSRQEAERLQAQGWRSIHLGARILRAETAAIAAASLVIYG